MGRRFELDRELNHISAAWMSWLCAEAQTVGYQIRTQGLFFFFPPLPFLSFSPSLSLFSIVARPFRSFCLALLLSLTPALFPPLLLVSFSLSETG